MKEERSDIRGPKTRLDKSPTGIDGLDEITEGGLPRLRSTLVCGGPGSGKTLLAVEFVVNGITEYDEPGAIVTFEESRADLAANFASLGVELEALVEQRRLFINQIDFDPQDVVEVGEFDLEGLFAQIGHAIDSVGAKRVAIDGIETLFSFFSREKTIRMELKRLLGWLKKRGVTAVVTAERGEHPYRLTRHGVEEYVSDCVILLDQRIQDQIATRRLHIYKYRGSVHGTNEYPFIIDNEGISVLPVTSLRLDHDVSSERVSTGIAELDRMFGGKGFYKGSSILVSGTSGTGKSSFAAHFARSICEGGKRCLYLAFEESAPQIIRNMQSIGLDLRSALERDRLFFHAVRPTLFGLEKHLMGILQAVRAADPEAVVIDPISNLTSVGSISDIKLLFVRILDYLKKRQITTLCTDLTWGGAPAEITEVGISSLMDTWILLKNEQEENGQRRSLNILKSRGMAHSSKVRFFEITDDGIVLATEETR